VESAAVEPLLSVEDSMGRLHGVVGRVNRGADEGGWQPSRASFTYSASLTDC
jgi:hypothetical protein